MTNTAPTTASTTLATAPTPMRVAERDVVVDGVRLHVRTVGAADAPTVLVLHGMLGHRRDWDVLIDALGAHHRVVTVDQRGHGRSAWTESYRVGELAADAIGLIETLDLAPVPIVGHSMGAMVALLVAARRPDLVDRIAVIDIVPTSLATEFGRQLPEVLATLASVSYATVDDAVAEWIAGNPLARPELLRNYVAHAVVPDAAGRLRWGFDAARLHTFVDSVTPEQLWEAIDAVTCPCLVVRGEHSPLTTDAEAWEVARRLGDARLVEIAGGGHDLGVEQPEAVTDAVAAFLRTRVS